MTIYKNITIVEPHYDDAWINLGGYILKHPKTDFKIISISHNLANKKYETQKLPKILPNVKTKALRFRGVSWGFVHRIKRENYEKFFLKINKLGSLLSVSKIIEDECKDQDIVFMPLGTLHPQHIVVSNLNLNLPVRYYIEWPYCYEEPGYFDPLIDNAEVVDISDVLTRKIDIFSQVYKSQLDLLEMTPKAGTLLSKNKQEIIVTRKL